MVARQVKVKSRSHFFAALASSAAYKSVLNCKIRFPKSASKIRYSMQINAHDGL